MDTGLPPRRTRGAEAPYYVLRRAFEPRLFSPTRRAFDLSLFWLFFLSFFRLAPKLFPEIIYGFAKKSIVPLDES